MAGCGGSDEPEGEKLPQASVAELNQRLDEIQRRYDDARENQNPGACEDIQNDSFPEVKSILDALPEDVDVPAARCHRGELRPAAAADRGGLPGHPADGDRDHADGDDSAGDHAARDHPARDHPARDHPARDHPAADHARQQRGGNGGTDSGGTGGGGTEAPQGRGD